MSLLALGLMSGTSLDGIDAALLRTDGLDVAEPGPALTLPYAEATRAKLRQVLGRDQPDALTDDVTREITLLHADAVHQLLEQHRISAKEVDVIGFHGHTILHRPEARRRTWQIGDGALLARQCGIDVVNDFRSADVAAGGEGAPLAPLYHQALARDFDRPVAILNIGGVANVTWIGEGGIGEGDTDRDEEDLIAFDTGPGNAMVDDWVGKMCGQPFDRDGALASAGRVHGQTLDRLLDHPYFAQTPPKSLDRNDFAVDMADGLLGGLSAADGAATLVAFTVAAVARGAEHFPSPARRWLVTGGGRHNPAIMTALGAALGVTPAPVEHVGWNGDALEAQAFAFLAVRALNKLPVTAPSVTGCGAPVLGGKLHKKPE